MKLNYSKIQDLTVQRRLKMQLPKTEEFIETTILILTTRNNKFEDPEKLENAKITTRRQESNHGTEQQCCLG